MGRWAKPRLVVGALQPGVSGASTLGIAGLRADQGCDAHNAGNARDAGKARGARKARHARDASKARHASNARDVGNARQRQTVSMTFVARRSSMAA